MGRERYWSRSFRRGEKESVGCMSGVLHFFDFHQIQFCTQPQQESQPCETDSLRGLEAPRNSLELDVDTPLSFTPTSVVEDIPIGIRLHPIQPKSLERELSSEASSLQGSKTPNLVARLMGLDILPDEVSPRPSYSPMRSHSSRTSVQRRDGILPVNETTRYDSGIRSLPDTPRISSARRSDVGPRLSLQLNKENVETPELNYYNASAARDSFSSSSSFASRKSRTREGRFFEENRSPTTYAREIVKQVKESVSRRVGLDITNISGSSSSRNRCRGESVSPSINIRKTTKKPCKATDESKQSKTPTPSCSPRLKFLETKTKSMENKDPITSNSNSTKPSSPKPSPITTTSTPLSALIMKEPSPKSKSKPLPKSTAKCRKATCERFTQRPSSNSQTGLKKCKIPLSIQIQHPHSNTIQKPAHAQAQTVVSSLSPCGSSQQQQRQQYEQQHRKPKQPRDDRDDSSIRTTVTDGADFRYVNEILHRTNIDSNATTWFHHLDPTLSHQLELEPSFHATTTGPLQQSCNRRLLFDLIDEILLYNSIKPHLGLLRREPLISSSFSSSNRLLSQVRSILSVKCEAPDIDGLVGFDLSRGNVGWGACCGSQDEEGELVAFELEREIMDSLVDETLLLLMFSTRKRFGEFQSQPFPTVIEM
ncbi:protein of unknown function DUF4378 [Cinnamomum micranthum f. kanehirae]|uniref:Uncharacterized protein n=1 Tax=Cinnamomum micranthum f. kanehirae TaxID=337451 RepID=A0A443NQY3_9MAGN|nr:protein of unknown function DUF4378 [Cinnamomum micranthum f. kanehirae]